MCYLQFTYEQDEDSPGRDSTTVSVPGVTPQHGRPPPPDILRKIPKIPDVLAGQPDTPAPDWAVPVL